MQMPKTHEGCLVVLLLSADLERDTDLFSKMDPYVIFRLNDQKAKSQIKDEAGKNPEWNESFSFRCKEGDVLFFNVMDKDPGKDDEVGNGRVNVHRDFIDNRASYLYPIQFKGKQVGTVTLQLMFMPDDTEAVSLVQTLQKELDDKRNIVVEIRKDIDENRKNPPRPKPESLLMKNLLDIFETKKNMDKELIESTLAKAEAPFQDQLKELNGVLDKLEKETQDIQLRNAESLDLVNQASYRLSLFKSLSEKGVLKVRVLDLELAKDKKYDPYVNFLIDRQNYKTAVAKGMKKSVAFNSSFEARRINDDMVIISVFHQSSVGSDDLLGSGAVDLVPVVTSKNVMNLTVELGLKQQIVGVLKMEMAFVKD